MFYAIHNTHETEAATLYCRYQAESHYQRKATPIKGWVGPIKTSATREIPSIHFPDTIPSDIITAQELSMSDLWDSPENDVWDDLYKEMND